MFNFDDKDIRRLERDLDVFASRALPFATRETLNTTAFTTQDFARSVVKIQMTLRNKFTLQSIRVEKARGLRISTQESRAGSTADYMADQEFGATKVKESAEGLPIATSFAAGESENAQPRTKLPKPRNTLHNISLQKGRRKGKNRKQRNLIAVIDAVNSGKRFAFLRFNRTKGIFRVVGGRKNPKKGGPKGAKLKMVHDLTEQSVTIPPNPWLQPAVDKVIPLVPEIYKNKLEFQLKRHRLFK